MTASCAFEKDIDLDTNGGKGIQFVHFETPSASWIVSKDDESYTYEIPVFQTFKSDEPQTYSIKVGEGTTKDAEGKLFSLSANSVTIPAGEFSDTLKVTVNYANIPDPDPTGFTVEIVVDTDKISPAYGNSTILSFKSDKIVMDWEWLAGKWTASDFCYYSGAIEGDPYSMAITKVDENKATISNIWGTGADLEATVDFEAKTITIPGNQFTYHEDYYDCDMIFVAVDPATEYDIYEDLTTPVVATFSPAGIVIDNWDLLMKGGLYDGYTYGGGYRTTLVK